MKILAIRGRNLASLSSEFAVDFQAEPLASAGLFAITGPTGAGKSTLLDALCLALYERTPRLARATARGVNIPDVGDGGVAPADPRTILRRGAADGYAEVDFVGSDHVPYRARWSVRRADNRADGNLQRSGVTLKRLTDGQSLGDHRKTETLKLIESIIGLNFDQFTRAVLLAQNDFAAFLKASDDERAELLQTLTGTETFTRLSVQAYARMKSEREQLDRLAVQLADQAPLAPGIRAEKEANLKQQGEKLKGLENAKAQLESHLRWHQQLAALKLAEVEAGKAVAAARAARADAAARGRQLARIERVQPARSLCAELDRLAREIAAAEKTAAGRQNDLLAAGKLADARKADAESASGRLAAAEEARTKAQPQIDAAKALDAKIAALDPQYQAAVKAHDEAARQHRDAAKKRDEAKRTLAESEAKLAAAERWLSEHAALRPLAEGWQRWEALFAQAGAVHGERARISDQIGELSKRDRKIAGTVQKAQAAHASRVAAAASAEAELAARTKTWAAFDAEAAGRRRRQFEERRDQLQAGALLWTSIVEQQQRQRQFDAQKQSLTAAIARCEAVLAEHLAKKPLLEQASAAAERALDLARFAASDGAESMRALLRAGEPCPVCGATDHPDAGRSPQADAMLAALSGNVEAARQAVHALVRGMAQAESEKSAAQKQLAQAGTDLAAATRALADLQGRWADCLLAAELVTVEDAGRGDWFREQQAALKAALEQLGAEEAGHREAARQRDAAQAALDKAKRALETAREALARAEGEQKTTRLELETARQRLVETGGQLDAILGELDAGLAGAGWRERWLAGPAGFVAGCRGEAEAWLGRQKEVADLSGKTGTLKVAIAGHEEACAKAALQLQGQAELRQGLDVGLQALRRERRALFDGQPAAEVEAALAGAVDEARAKLTQAQAGSHQAERERAGLEEAERLARAALEGHRSARLEAVRRFDAWLAEFNAGADAETLSAEAVTSLLVFDGDWIAREREALQALERAVASSEAVLKSHEDVRARHEAARPTAEGTDALAETLARAQAELAAVSEAVANLKAELAGDDARLLRSQALRGEIDKQAARTRVWSQLGELIGSADGRKFRNFAQQLTLDILLGYANRHLESLSRRYRLERIRDSLGLLVVDQDMGDEVRSVHSLSGGESFLVSLALALGLASLSSHRVRVESLFIDEGFGSLDSDSLRIAMDALDNLQALGRKVGVISHVQEMTERIGTRVQVRRQAGGQSRVVVA